MVRRSGCVIASMWYLVHSALPASARTTTVTLVQNNRTSLVEVSADAPLLVKADGSQSGPTPATTILQGHVTLTVQRKQGPLTLNADQATVESQLIEVQVAPISDPVIDIGSDISSLALALKAFPSAPAFRVTWNFVGLGASVDATELYRRSERTLSLYRIDSDEMGLRTTREFYTKVQDSVIHTFSTHRVPGDPKSLTDFGASYDARNSYQFRPQAK